MELIQQKRAELKEAFRREKESFVVLCGGEDKARRHALTVMEAALKNKDLMRCSKESLILAAKEAAELGLAVGTATRQAYLVPYGTNCQMIPGYSGLVTLVHRTGKVGKVWARLVKADEPFKLLGGTDDRIVHELLKDCSAPPIGAYAVCRMRSGEEQWEYMNIEELEAIRSRSAARNSGPWKTDTGEMYKKTVLKRLLKYLPVGEFEFIQRFEEFDNRQYQQSTQVSLSDYDVSLPGGAGQTTRPITEPGAATPGSAELPEPHRARPPSQTLTESEELQKNLRLACQELRKRGGDPSNIVDESTIASLEGKYAAQILGRLEERLQ